MIGVGILIAVFGVFLSGASLHLRSQSRKIANWPSVKGNVTDSSIDERWGGSAGTQYFFSVQYEYTVGSSKHTGHAVSPSHGIAETEERDGSGRFL